jgi:outer membrane protein assembly factor BamB
MGNLVCLDAETGAEVWSKDFPKEYGAKAPLWGFCGHPLIDGERLICIVGGEGTAAVAFDKESGREIWRSLSSKEPGYSAPVVIRAGGVRQLLIWHGEALNALNPESGKLYWSFPLAPRMAMGIMVPRVDGEYLFAGAVYGTAVALKLSADEPTVSLAWRGPENMKDAGLFPMNMTPFAEGGVLYGVDQPGQFRAVKIGTGERLWESWSPLTGESESRPVYTGTVFVVKNGDRFFMFNERGELVIARLSPSSYEELGRCKLLEPTGSAFGREVVWSHPAFANRCVYARNDNEIVCVSLASDES